MSDKFNGRQGRQKGQTKDVVIIKDPSFPDYEIHQDSNCYSLILVKNDNRTTVGYYSSLVGTLQRLVKNSLVEKKSTYSLKEYIEEYKNLTENFKQAIEI